jgi:hypothetical protein
MTDPTIQEARAYAAANTPQTVEVIGRRRHPAGLDVVTVRDLVTGDTWEAPAAFWKSA